MRILEHRFGYGLTIGVLLICGFGALYSFQFQAVSMWFPFFAGTAGALVAALVLVFDIVGDRRHGIDRDGPRDGADDDDDDDESRPLDLADVELETGHLPAIETADDTPRGILTGFTRYLAWFVGFVAMFLLVGVLIAVPVWLILFVRFAAKESWLRAAVSAVAMTALVFALTAFLHLAMPDGVLIDSGAIIPSIRL